MSHTHRVNQLPSRAPVVVQGAWTITREWLRALLDIATKIEGDPKGAHVLWGEGDPSGVVEANVGTLYLRTDGGAGTTLYIKESGSGTTAGWAAK